MNGLGDWLQGERKVEGGGQEEAGLDRGGEVAVTVDRWGQREEDGQFRRVQLPGKARSSFCGQRGLYALVVLTLVLTMMLLPTQLALADPSAAEFGQVVPDRPLVFPEDTGAHPGFRIEWWYITGWLSDAEGAERGFQLTFFRVGTGIGADNPSRFAPRHLILAHAAIADPAGGRLRHAEAAERALEPLAGAVTGRTQVWLRDWELRLADEGYQARVVTPDFTLDLRLVPPGPPVLNGRGGFSQKTPDPAAASYYYSRPHLAVTGQLRLDGEVRAVSGQAWLDHEWSSELLSPEAAGWDWIGINLHDGGSLMAFQMRHREGGALWMAGTLVAPGGLPRALAPGEVRFRPGRLWRSPRTGKTYPVTWELAIAGENWRLQPVMDDQELDGRRSTGVVYWEGAVRLLAGEREIGRGYLEMTGY